jgi:outer membrane lipoprotein SlyB
MNTPRLPLTLALVALGFSVGCTFPSRGTVYDRSHVGRTMHIDVGDIVAVRDVTISGRETAIGVTGGGLVGHASAGTIGKGAGSTIAAAGGAVVGAVVGSAVEEVATRRTAQEIVVKLKNGETIAVVQESKDGPFIVGEHVQVLSGGAGSTIRRM